METTDGTYNLYTRSLAFLSSCPDFSFSKFPLALNQHSLVSFTRWIDLVGTRSDGTGRLYDSVTDIPLVELLIRLRDDVTDADKKAFSKELEEFVTSISTSSQSLKSYSFEGILLPLILPFSPSPSLSIHTHSFSPFSGSNEALEKADIAISFFFAFTTVVAMAICFFSLTSSMYTNVRENAKETGVCVWRGGICGIF